MRKLNSLTENGWNLSYECETKKKVDEYFLQSKMSLLTHNLAFKTIQIISNEIWWFDLLITQVFIMLIVHFLQKSFSQRMNQSEF